MAIDLIPAPKTKIQVISSSRENREEFQPSDNNGRITRKVDLKLIPFLALLEMSSYMNQTSIGMYFE